MNHYIVRYITPDGQWSRWIEVPEDKLLEWLSSEVFSGVGDFQVHYHGKR